MAGVPAGALALAALSPLSLALASLMLQYSGALPPGTSAVAGTGPLQVEAAFTANEAAYKLLHPRSHLQSVALKIDNRRAEPSNQRSTYHSHDSLILTVKSGVLSPVKARFAD